MQCPVDIFALERDAWAEHGRGRGHSGHFEADLALPQRGLGPAAGQWYADAVNVQGRVGVTRATVQQIMEMEAELGRRRDRQSAETETETETGTEPVDEVGERVRWCRERDRRRALVAGALVASLPNKDDDNVNVNKGPEPVSAVVSRAQSELIARRDRRTGYLNLKRTLERIVLFVLVVALGICGIVSYRSYVREGEVVPADGPWFIASIILAGATFDRVVKLWLLVLKQRDELSVLDHILAKQVVDEYALDIDDFHPKDE